MDTGSFPGVETGRGVKLTPHLLLVPRSKQQSRTIPLLSLMAFLACKKGETYLLLRIVCVCVYIYSLYTVYILGCLRGRL
jgi:hypothetical protein